MNWWWKQSRCTLHYYQSVESHNYTILHFESRNLGRVRLLKEIPAPVQERLIRLGHVISLVVINVIHVSGDWRKMVRNNVSQIEQVSMRRKP